MDEKQGPKVSCLSVVVVLLVIGFGIALCLPSIEASREAARRVTCISNMKQIGLGFHGFADVHKRFPPSCGVTEEQGKIRAPDGWSWEVALLPYICQEALWRTLDVKHSKPLAPAAGLTSGNERRAAALNTFHGEFFCPSNDLVKYADPATQTGAISNYKAIGATHAESLSIASPQPLTPKYNPKGIHPDGVCFPGKGTPLSDIVDGTSNTVLVAETIEPVFARWTVGAEATLVGFPPEATFVPFDTYYAPTGFTAGKYEEDSTVTVKTYLMRDWKQQPYDGADGTKGGMYGASSKHPGVVNHLFCDGGVRSLPLEIDPALYMFIITRNGGDPGADCFTYYK